MTVVQISSLTLLRSRPRSRAYSCGSISPDCLSGLVDVEGSSRGHAQMGLVGLLKPSLGDTFRSRAEPASVSASAVIFDIYCIYPALLHEKGIFSTDARPDSTSNRAPLFRCVLDCFRWSFQFGCLHGPFPPTLFEFAAHPVTEQFDQREFPG